MSLIVQKFGGTSVGSIERIENVANRVIAARQQGHQVVVVVSAMSGDTNHLVNLSKQVSDDPNLREYDLLLATGEMVSIALVSMMLSKKGHAARSYTANQVRIITEDIHKNAHVKAIETENLFADLQQGVIPVVAGFQGVNSDGDFTTLGRGGSDATAVALAAALNADECQIFTDVDGVYTADPRIVKDAKQLAKISYDEMLIMAGAGAKVLQTQSVELACQSQVPLRVLSSFTQNPGTLLCHRLARLDANPITAVVSKRDVAKISIRYPQNDQEILSLLLELLASRHITVDLLQQDLDAIAQEVVLSIIVARDDWALAQMLLGELAQNRQLAEPCSTGGLAILSLVGRGLTTHQDVMRKMFSVLRQVNIQIQLLSLSEIRISSIIFEDFLEIGVKSLHNAFELSQEDIEFMPLEE